MTLTEKAALLPDADTELLFNLILEMAQAIDKLTGVEPDTLDKEG